MKNWLYRIRGLLGTALTWAAVWFPVGAVMGLVLRPLGVSDPALLFALAGFLTGATFSVVLGITEGRRRFDEMSLPRFAGWGAFGGLLSAVLFFSSTGGSLLGTVVVSSVLTVLGAGSAAGSLTLARRADDRDLLEAGEKALGLLEGEAVQ